MLSEGKWGEAFNGTYSSLHRQQKLLIKSSHVTSINKLALLVLFFPLPLSFLLCFNLFMLGSIVSFLSLSLSHQQRSSSKFVIGIIFPDSLYRFAVAQHFGTVSTDESSRRKISAQQHTHKSESFCSKIIWIKRCLPLFFFWEIGREP